MRSPIIAVCTADMGSSSAYIKVLKVTGGAEVYSAFSGQDLMGLLDQHKYAFDVIICDVDLPGITADELADYIALHSGRYIPMVGLAKFPETLEEEEAFMILSESFATMLERGSSPEAVLQACADLLNAGQPVETPVVSDEELRREAQKLEETSTVVLDRSDFEDYIKEYGKNRGRQSMIDDISRS